MKPLALAIFCITLMACTLLLYSSTAWYKSSLEPRYVPAIPMTFDHQTHGKEQCIDCHHNFIDNSGQGLCIQCHLTNESVNTQFEEQFHALCMGCHQEKQIAGDQHGPIRQCIDCHTTDQLP